MLHLGMDAIGFIDSLIHVYGDYSPETEKILLPPCITKYIYIYEEYQMHPVEHVTEHHFYKLLNINLKQMVVFASVSTGFIMKRNSLLYPVSKMQELHTLTNYPKNVCKKKIEEYILSENCKVSSISYYSFAKLFFSDPFGFCDISMYI